IRAQLETLHLTEEGQNIASQMEQGFKGLMQTKYHGKNYHLTMFLNKHFHTESQTYCFMSGQCSKTQLHVGMVDDLDKIAEAMSCLGTENFFGIKASRGGNPPKGEVSDDDYYCDDYLILLAKRIGLVTFVCDVLEERVVPIEENAMLQIAALLYAWHIEPKRSLTPFQSLAKHLTQAECDQVANMLAYIKVHANCHPHAHYVPVDELHYFFQCMADQAFLSTFNQQLFSIKQQRTNVKSQASLIEPPIKAEPSRG
ncbi:MAG TPA: hypothetical protein PLD88_14560, partial [Candidatus Berkiella sp.]|nr:hypothetical protein [Candidatus Berkiella sp.]